MQTNTRMQITIITAMFAALVACGPPLAGTPTPPVQNDPSVPDGPARPDDPATPDDPAPVPAPALWCGLAPLQILDLGNRAFLVRNLAHQFLVVPRALDCPAKLELVKRLGRGCDLATCPELDPVALPGSLARGSDGSQAFTAHVYEINPSAIGGIEGARLVHWVGRDHEVIQMPLSLDMHAVLSGPRPGAPAAPRASIPGVSSMLDCTPCQCVGGQDPGERPESRLAPQCVCPKDRIDACARAAPATCECYDTCCR